MLQQTQDITISAIQPPSGTTLPSCELVIGGQPSGYRVEGCILEAAIKCVGGYLIFLTDDIPYEDSLNIHLIDHSGLLQDTARIGSIYSTGSFQDLQIQQPDKVAFRFIGDTVWCVQTLPKPALRIPLVSEPAGVHRPIGFKRHFAILRKPQTIPC